MRKITRFGKDELVSIERARYKKAETQIDQVEAILEEMGILPVMKGHIMLMVWMGVIRPEESEEELIAEKAEPERSKP